MTYAQLPPQAPQPAAALLRTTGLLRTWLTVYQVFSGVVSGLFALGIIVFGVVLMLVPRTGQSLFRTSPFDPFGDSLSGLGRGLGLVLLLTGLLTALAVALLVLVVGWAKEWEGQAAGLATHQGGNPARLAALRATLGKWISFSQWGMVVYFALIALAAIGFALLFARLPGISSDFTNTDDARFFTTFMAVLLPLGIIIAGAPTCILNWLILAAIRRFMNAGSDRLLGANVLVRPSAASVNGWFIFLLVVIGLGLASVLVQLPLNALSATLFNLPSVSRENDLPANLAHVLTAVTLVSFLLSALIYALYFLVVLWSRGFADSLAATLDGPLPPPVYAPPANAYTPPSNLPPGQ